MYRKAEAGDCKGVYDLICDLEKKQLPWDRFEKIYQNQVTSDNYYHLVCQEGDKIVGVLTMRFEEQLHHADRIAEPLEFSIHESCRGKGIGREMFALACQVAREAGCCQIELATNQLRKDAHRFYAREGMNNFHYKFSMPLNGEAVKENAIGNG